jgi:hypothetical protein
MSNTNINTSANELPPLSRTQRAAHVIRHLRSTLRHLPLVLTDFAELPSPVDLLQNPQSRRRHSIRLHGNSKYLRHFVHKPTGVHIWLCVLPFLVRVRRFNQQLSDVAQGLGFTRHLFGEQPPQEPYLRPFYDLVPDIYHPLDSAKRHLQCFNSQVQLWYLDSALYGPLPLQPLGEAFEEEPHLHHQQQPQEQPEQLMDLELGLGLEPAAYLIPEDDFGLEIQDHGDASSAGTLFDPQLLGISDFTQIEDPHDFEVQGLFH